MRFFSLLILVFMLFAYPIVGASAQTIKTGTITGKSVKWTTGSVRIVRTSGGHELRLAENFKTKKGPSLWVYLGNVKPEKRIGRLKSVNGAQVYALPASVKIEDYSSVFIYCVPFNAVFGFAVLR